MSTVAPPAPGLTTPQDPPQPIAPPVAMPVVMPIAPAPAQQSLPIVVPPADVPGLDDEDRKDGIDVADNRLTVPVSAFKRIKERTADRARKDAETSIFRELGVDSLDAAKALITKSKETPVMPDPVPPAPPAVAAVPPPAAIVPPAPIAAMPPPPAIVAPVAAEDRALPAATREKLRAERETAEAATKQANADAAAARAQVAAKDAEIAVIREDQRLRESLITAGCVEVDFAFGKLKEHIRSLDDAALKALDVKAWAGELKTAKPFLFGATVAPANTGAGGGAPTPPSPGAVNGGAGAAGARDFRSMTDAERKAALPAGIKLPLGSRVRKS